MTRSVLFLAKFHYFFSIDQTGPKLAPLSRTSLQLNVAVATLKGQAASRQACAPRACHRRDREYDRRLLHYLHLLLAPLRPKRSHPCVIDSYSHRDECNDK